MEREPADSKRTSFINSANQDEVNVRFKWLYDDNALGSIEPTVLVGETHMTGLIQRLEAVGNFALKCFESMPVTYLMRRSYQRNIPGR